MALYLLSVSLPLWPGSEGSFKIVEKCFNADFDSNNKCIFYSCLVKACFLNISSAVNALLESLNYWVYIPYEKEAVAPKLSTDKKITYVESLFR